MQNINLPKIEKIIFFIVRTKENWPLKTRVWEVSWKCPPRAVFVQVNLSNVMDPLFCKFSIVSWLHVSIECSHVWNRILPKWEEICFDVQKRLRSYFEILARGCVCQQIYLVKWSCSLLKWLSILMVITWGRKQSAKVEEKLFLHEVKNNFVLVLN